MARKLMLWLILGLLIGAAVYGWLNYALVGLYEPGRPKVAHLHLVPKPERDVGFFYSNVDEVEAEQKIQRLTRKGEPVPWYLDQQYIQRHSLYRLTMDTDVSN